MMTPETRDLIARAIDGGLSAAERKQLETVLRQDESARAFHNQLKQDALALRSLRVVAPPVNIAEAVAGIIRDRNLTPTPLPPRPKVASSNANRGSWVNLATAAGLMLAVTAGSFFYFSSNLRAPHVRYADVATARDTIKKQTKTPDRPAPSVNTVQPESVETPVPETIVKAPAPVAPTVISPEQGPSPRVVEDSILTARPEPMPEINALNIPRHRVSRFLNLTDLASADPVQVKNQSEIRGELKADELVRLDLFCKDPRSALDQLSAALKARGATAIIDQHLTDRIKKKQTTEIVIFTDVLTPEEVFQLLGEMARNEMTAANGEGQFDTLVVAPFLPADLDLLGRILGAGAVMPKVAKSKGPVDIRKPLPEGTANQLAQNLSKMGGGSGPVTTTPPKPKNEKLAFVGSFTPPNPAPAQSTEIKSFLERRADKRPDAKPLMLVLRTIN